MYLSPLSVKGIAFLPVMHLWRVLVRKRSHSARINAAFVIIVVVAVVVVAVVVVAAPFPLQAAAVGATGGRLWANHN